MAVLHDVIEDTSVTADDLRQAGFSEKVVAAVLCVTHRKDEPYADYVVRCKGNEMPGGSSWPTWRTTPGWPAPSCDRSGLRPMSPGSANTSCRTSS